MARFSIETSQRFLESSLGGGPRLLVLLAVLLLIPCYVFPLYDMTMFAPQYPEGLRLHIYSYRLEGGHGFPTDGLELSAAAAAAAHHQGLDVVLCRRTGGCTQEQRGGERPAPT